MAGEGSLICQKLPLKPDRVGPGARLGLQGQCFYYLVVRMSQNDGLVLKSDDFRIYYDGSGVSLTAFESAAGWHVCIPV